MKYIWSMLLGISLLSSCSKDIKVESLKQLNITLDPAKLVGDSYQFKLGDTVKFLMTGKADNITFYSGETGKNYSNATRVSGIGKTLLSLTSSVTSGSQTNTLKVYAINKLEKLDYDFINTANWTDITSKVSLATSSTAVNATDIDLSDIITSATDSLYIAFKFTGTTGSAQRTWTITNLTLTNLLPDGTRSPLLTLASDANFWTKVKSPTSPASWAPSSSQLQIVGGAASAASNVSWVVSRPLDVKRVSPDLPTVLKHLGSEVPNFFSGGKSIDGHTYIYTKPGKYKATFVAFNTSIDRSESVLKEFNIEILP